MAKQANNPAMDKAFRAWLEAKGISQDDVLADYAIKHSDGMTRITMTVIAQDFPPAPKADNKEFLVDGSGHVWRYDPPRDGYLLFPGGKARSVEYIRERYGLERDGTPPVSRETECTRSVNECRVCEGACKLENLFPSNTINRPHTTCIDVTTAAERPYSSWVCGPDCPTEKLPEHTPMLDDDGKCWCTDCLDRAHKAAECTNGCAPGQHHWLSCLAK